MDFRVLIARCNKNIKNKSLVSGMAHNKSRLTSSIDVVEPNFFANRKGRSTHREWTNKKTFNEINVLPLFKSTFILKYSE